MELLEFTPENCVSGVTRSSNPSIGFQLKIGAFSFNIAAVEKLGLKDGDHIKLLQDSNDPENWYLEKVKEGGFQIRSKSAGKYSNLMFSNRFVAKKIAESIRFTGTSGKILLAGQPTKVEKRTLYGLLLNRLTNS